MTVCALRRLRGCTHISRRKQPPWAVCPIDFAPLLVQQLTDATFLRRYLFEVIETIEEEIAQVRHIRLALHAQMNHASLSRGRRQPFARKSAFREEDVKRFLFSLAERVGRMEVANRDLQQFLAGFIGTNHEDYVCPCCRSVLGQ